MFQDLPPVKFADKPLAATLFAGIPVRRSTSRCRERHAPCRLRRRVPVVHLTVRPAAHPGLHLVRLRRVARGHACGWRRLAVRCIMRSAGVRARILAGLHRARGVRERDRQVHLRQAAAPEQDCRRAHHPVRSAHDGRVQAGFPGQREARADAAEAGGTGRGVPRRPGVRVRLDAVHRPDPRGHPGGCRIARHRAARECCCWRSTRRGWASRSC